MNKKVKVKDLIMKVTSRVIEPVDWLSVIRIDEENHNIRSTIKEHYYCDLISTGYKIIIE